MKKIFLILLILLLASACRRSNLIPEGARGFSDEYIAEHTGKVSIEIPDVYEISHFVMALEDKDMSYSSFVRSDGSYYQDVMDHFGEYRDHPLIQNLDLASSLGLNVTYFERHYNYRGNSYLYELQGSRLRFKNIYTFMYRNPEIVNLFQLHLDDFIDFMRQSDAVGFLEEHRDFYREQEDWYHKGVDVKDMWMWLEEKFPRRFQACKVILSPLTRSSHNTLYFTNVSVAESRNQELFEEMIIFVSALRSDPALMTPVQRAANQRTVFTEIDHHYVNPITDRYVVRLDNAMQHLDKWNEDATGVYIGARSTFNEYMTWAVFCLWTLDREEEAIANEVIEGVVDVMENFRGFTKFSLFTQELISLYQADPSSLDQLYPPMLDWVEEEDKR
ncbi:MAG: DUF4932 domain-containing protein [Bacteroidota bacterium]